MIPSTRARFSDLAILLAVLALPLLGATVAERDLSGIFLFPPPLEIPSDHPHFSWTAVAAVVACLMLIAVSWNVGSRRSHLLRSPPQSQPTLPLKAKPFPGWGWIALVWTVAWWVLAWTRWSWSESVQRYTFFPLWIGLIVTVNALTQRRAGTCMMRRAPLAWLGLFATSALFWWIFEWLNRFVRNWHYLAVEDFGAAGYAVHASLCFSTVLPAVAGVAEWLGTHPRWVTRTAAGPSWRWLENRDIAGVLVLTGMSALVFTGAYPVLFYPALWLAPLALLLGRAVLLRRPGVARELAHGKWNRAATWMAAALLCGFFWELWNWQSLAKWIYTVPGVERWHVFEMPLLGYAGYLPFGVECLLVVEWVAGDAGPATQRPVALDAGPAPLRAVSARAVAPKPADSMPPLTPSNSAAHEYSWRARTRRGLDNDAS